MKIVNRAVLIGGLQNLWQLGALYPLNLLATFHYISKARFNIRTLLDVLIVVYVGAGVLSLVTGLMVAVVEGADSDLLVNQVKSFFVFLGVLVFFGAYQLKIEELFKVAMWVFGLTVVAILISYVYIILTDPISLYLTRSKIAWCSGWPQRWVMFCIIGHFVFLCRFDSEKKAIDLVVAIAFLTALLLSATRSAVLGVVMGYFVLSFLSRRDFLRSMTIVLLVAFTASFFVKEIQEAFRIQEVVEYSSTDGADGSSVNNRTKNLWPGIVESLGIVRMPFGWGHVGLAYIPHTYFVDTSQLSDIPGEKSGSAESQYMDVLLRQGVVGLVLLMTILVCGLYYSYKLYKLDTNADRRALWKAALAWQTAILVHGITVETLRLSLYSLFFFLFLGILSENYYRVKKRSVATLQLVPGIASRASGDA